MTTTFTHSSRILEKLKHYDELIYIATVNLPCDIEKEEQLGRLINERARIQKELLSLNK